MATKLADTGDPIMDAIRNNDLPKVEYLVALSGSECVNHTTAIGLTPLMLASAKGQAQIVKLLINCGANVNAVDNNGWTALMGAVAQGWINTTQLLLEAGADTEIRNDKGENVLDIAYDPGRKCYKCAKVIKDFLSAPEGNLRTLKTYVAKVNSQLGDLRSMLDTIFDILSKLEEKEKNR